MRPDAKPAFDRPGMLERLGGDEDFLAEILGVYLEESPGMLDRARAALASRDGSTVERAAHTLKGALLNISAAPAAEAASRLEQLGRAGDMDGGAAALRELEARLHDLELELRPAVEAVEAVEE